MHTQQLSASEFKRALDIHVEKHTTSDVFINICTPAEFTEAHIHDSINIPLDTLKAHSELLRTKERIYVYCKSGIRSKQALAELESLALPAHCFILDGGQSAWEKAEYPIERSEKRFSLLQQMFLIVGVGCIAGVVLGYLVSPLFYILPFAIGCGLTYAGYSGNCLLTSLLARLPWNKA